MTHVVILGDSVFDNAAYVGGGADVSTHLRALVPEHDFTQRRTQVFA